MWSFTILMNLIGWLIVITFFLLGNASFFSALIFTHIDCICYLFIICEVIGRFTFVKLLINIILSQNLCQFALIKSFFIIIVFVSFFIRFLLTIIFTFIILLIELIRGFVQLFTLILCVLIEVCLVMI